MLVVALIRDGERDLCHLGYERCYYTALLNCPTHQQGQMNHRVSKLILARILLVDPEELLTFIQHADETAEAGVFGFEQGVEFAQG